MQTQEQNAVSEYKKKIMVTVNLIKPHPKGSIEFSLWFCLCLKTQ